MKHGFTNRRDTWSFLICLAATLLAFILLFPYSMGTVQEDAPNYKAERLGEFSKVCHVRGLNWDYWTTKENC